MRAALVLELLWQSFPALCAHIKGPWDVSGLCVNTAESLVYRKCGDWEEHTEVFEPHWQIPTDNNKKQKLGGESGPLTKIGNASQSSQCAEHTM